VAIKKADGFESAFVLHLIDEYYGGNVDAFAARVGYTKQQIGTWCSGKRKPQKATLRWLLSTTIAPEFKVAAEFKPVSFATKASIRPTMRDVLSGHADNSGVYAFYDSMCAVVYIGKASKSFHVEMCQQLEGPLGIKFPKAVAKAPSSRWQAVSYVSAYEIPSVDHLDYPKHVEALVLRLSKPIGNKVLGILKTSSPPAEK
jgi:hypothetical protein